MAKLEDVGVSRLETVEYCTLINPKGRVPWALPVGE
jgi:hypothetical protein